MKKIKIVLMLLTSLFIVSCESTTVQEIQPVVTNPTYNANIKSIFSSKCMSCHTTSGNQYPALGNYDQIRDAIENGSVICRIENQCGSVMPPNGKMQQVFIDMVNNWKVQGFVQ